MILMMHMSETLYGLEYVNLKDTRSPTGRLDGCSEYQKLVLQPIAQLLKGIHTKMLHLITNHKIQDRWHQELLQAYGHESKLEAGHSSK